MAMIDLNDLVFEVTSDCGGKWLVSIWYTPKDEQQKVKYFSCSSLACVADLLVSIEKVFDLFKFDESEVLSYES